MSPVPFLTRTICLSFSVAFLLHTQPNLWAAAGKPIRLRNEILANPAADADQLSGVRQSGLFLIQFTNRVHPQWRMQLQQLGVDLLRYVPDDAYVARLVGTAPRAVRQLGFVRSLVRYRPDHKMHPTLARQAAGGAGGGGGAGAAAGDELNVVLLCAPRATQVEVGALRRTLAAVQQETRLRFGTIIRARVARHQLAALAQSDAVLWMEPAPRMKLVDEIASKIVGGDDLQIGTRTLTQQLGYDGTGVSVAVADSGLNNGDAESMHPDLAGRVTAFFHYGRLEDAADEHSHGTHVAGIVAGNGAVGETDEFGSIYGLGVAPGASIIAQRIFDGVGGYEAPPSFEALTRDAVRAGADIGSNSWGDDTQGRYDLSAAEFDALVRDADGLAAGDQPYIVEFSAGNAGPGARTIGSPAVAKNVIATGASQNNRLEFFIYADGQEAMADFSSRGPCEDGRIKPDVVAPGTWIASLQSASATDENAWSAISGYYQYQGGTSQAGPHVSGAAAVFVQFYRATHTNATPSPALVKAALINSAVDLDDSVETGPVPNNDEGWGRVDVSELVGSARSYQLFEQGEGLTTGQVAEHRILVAGEELPLKITLVYTDVPGFPGAIPALVNDLDLEVVAPDGTIYRGNQFLDGESVPDSPSFDSINNVEGVHLLFPGAGEYLVRVHARNVAEDAVQSSPAIDQDYALVVSAQTPLPGVGLIAFDRAAYRTPQTIQLKLVDHDLAGQASVGILVRSSSEFGGESIILLPQGNSGTFTGAVQTATGPGSPDGVLQIQHGDILEAIYVDASPSAVRIATARGDFLPPTIFDSTVLQRLGKTIIAFDTDEPARSVLSYGTNQTPSLVLTNGGVRTSHEIALADLIPGIAYYFSIIVMDAAGNTTTNHLEPFVPQLPPTVLLVDRYTDTFFDVPPLSGYTSALTEAGIDFVLWTEDNSPSATDMRPFRTVIWRLPEFVDTFSPAEQSALTNYLNGGGSLFVASMEMLSRLDEGGFTEFRKSVFQVEDYDFDTGVSSIAGNANDPFTSGFAADLNYVLYEDEFKELLELPADVSDTMVLSANATPILYDSSSDEVVGLRWPRTGNESAGRLVFLSFPLDAIPTTGPNGNPRAELLRKIIGFLTPLDNAGFVALDNVVYSVPGRVAVEVTDSDLAGQGQTSVRFISSADPDGQWITLRESVRRGVFRGSITLVPASSQSASNELRVTSTDHLRALYFDESAGSTVSADADVETEAPSISNVEFEPDYQEALVYWDTSEPCDALVQFGESPLLGRTAYSANLATTHVLSLAGLQPDRVYYFQVVSRDRAGNATVDDNGGQFYTFRTLRPLHPPWQDSLESGAGEWTIYDVDGSEVQWQLGVPSPFHEAPYSGASVWSSNLSGRPISFVESFLISPPVELTGGNRATLHFYQNYQFSEREGDVFEFGEWMIITNTTAEPVSLGSTEDFSDGWELTEVDLTPHLGQVVYFVWHYVLFSLENYNRPGWSIDDISVTVDNISPGTIVVSNNLSQAIFVLSGPVSRNGQGVDLRITNAPAGEYQVTFGDVPYYQTPPSQTRVLIAGATAAFNGQYTFADLNHNRISDAWEQAVFQEISPQRTETTDSDGDGATDLAEFMAGTNPKDRLSKPQLGLRRLGNGNIRLEWQGVAGRSYRIDGSSNAVTWTEVRPQVRANANAALDFTVPATAAEAFFKLFITP